MDPGEVFNSSQLVSFYTVQLIATQNQSKAEKLFQNLLILDVSDAQLLNENNFWKIQIGQFRSYKDAAKTLATYREMGFVDSWITKKEQ